MPLASSLSFSCKSVSFDSFYDFFLLHLSIVLVNVVHGRNCCSQMCIIIIFKLNCGKCSQKRAKWSLERAAGAYGIIKHHTLCLTRAIIPQEKLVSHHLVAPEGRSPIIRLCASAGSQRATERLNKLSARCKKQNVKQGKCLELKQFWMDLFHLLWRSSFV